MQGLKRAGPVIVVRGEGRRAPGISAKFGADSARGKWIASNGLRSRVLGIWLLEGESVGAAGQWASGDGVVHGVAGSWRGQRGAAQRSPGARRKKGREERALGRGTGRSDAERGERASGRARASGCAS